MRKGLSDVVFLAIMLLISLAIISLISLSLSNFLKPSLSPEFSCLDYQLDSPLEIQQICYNSETNQVELSLTRALNSPNLESFTILLSEHSYVCGEQCGSCTIPLAGETKKLYLETEEVSTDATIKIKECVIKSYLINLC